jgi:hypothetical protein
LKVDRFSAFGHGVAPAPERVDLANLVAAQIYATVSEPAAENS